MTLNLSLSHFLCTSITSVWQFVIEGSLEASKFQVSFHWINTYPSIAWQSGALGISKCGLPANLIAVYENPFHSSFQWYILLPLLRKGVLVDLYKTLPKAYKQNLPDGCIPLVIYQLWKVQDELTDILHHSLRLILSVYAGTDLVVIDCVEYRLRTCHPQPPVETCQVSFYLTYICHQPHEYRLLVFDVDTRPLPSYLLLGSL